MRMVLSIGNVILVTGIAFLGIIGMVLGFRWIGGKSVPVLTPLANGAVKAWEATAA